MTAWEQIKGWWQEARRRYEGVVELYGWSAITVYLVLFVGTFFGFWVALRQGFEIEGAAANLGTVGSAYVATKLTQPVRLLATAAITPVAVAAWQRSETLRRFGAFVASFGGLRKGQGDKGGKPK